MANQAIKIVVSKDGKWLETIAGMALYYFLPQSQDPKHQGMIPYMSQFPVSSREWIMQWNPLVGDPEFQGKDHGVDQDDFGVAERLGGPDEFGDQIMFRNWYLYTFNQDEPQQVEGEVAGIWQRVPRDLNRLKDNIDIPLEAYHGGP